MSIAIFTFTLFFLSVLHFLHNIFAQRQLKYHHLGFYIFTFDKSQVLH